MRYGAHGASIREETRGHRPTARGQNRRDARIPSPFALLATLGGLALGGCVAPGADVHLAPFYTRANTADAAIETEFLGGFGKVRYGAEDHELESFMLGPLYSWDALPEKEDGHTSHFAVPLGYSSRHGPESKTIFYPFFISGRSPETDGTSTYQLASLPGFLLENNSERGVQFGIFPLWGKFDDFVTFDRLVFIVWPIFVYAERSERVSYHFLWPIFGWTSGGGERSFRLWPFYSRTRLENRFDRTWVLWPLFHYQRNFLGGGNEEPETKWMLWPFYGQTERGTYKAHTWLWPFFGYSSDSRSGFWAFDAPWPLVRFQRGPDGVSRSRVWPFYSHTIADGLETTAYLWPLIQFRKERSTTMERDTTVFLPFWQSSERRDLASGETSEFKKLFPVFQYERDVDWERGSFPTLDPFWRNELIDRHYSWLWKVWEWEEEADMRRERAWLGLYRREKGLGEDRKSLTGLWSTRRYEREGKRVKETSLLFGLLRWRVTADDGFDMLPVAFPGPGWPAHGSASSGVAPARIQPAQTEDATP